MNLTKIAVKNRVLILFVCFISILASLYSYKSLGKLEDPPFTIKVAKIITSYQGASPEQVEKEVTETLENEISKLGFIYSLRSISQAGLSIITVEIKPEYSGAELPQVWDELRRKVRDATPYMPSGSSPAVIADDFGDVFGMLVALKGEGLSYMDLRNAAREMQKRVNAVEGVTRVSIAGAQNDNIFIEFSQKELVALGVSIQDIYRSIAAQSVVENAGDVSVLGESISVLPTGKFKTIDDVGKIRIINSNTGANVALKDIAKIYQGVQDPLSKALYINGKPALALAVSVSPKRNIIETGKDVEAILKAMQVELPLGLEMEKIYWQPDAVSDSVIGFMKNFVESFLIVFAVLLLSMGLRSSALVTISLLLNICVTFVLMYIFGISIQRISLGALIISLGMLVDNAIVVVQGIEYGRDKGLGFYRSVNKIIKQSAMPLLGATLIAILAFSPIGLSNDGTGEINRSLFQVVGLSLLSSWVIAIFVVPVIGTWFYSIKAKKQHDDGVDKESVDYVLKNSLFLRVYDKVLGFVLKSKIAFVLLCVGLLVHALQIQKVISKQFLPDSNMPMFTIDVWFPRGIDIRENSKQSNEIANFIQKLEHVEQVTAWVGGSAPRFLLPLYTEDDSSNYTNIVVKVKSQDDIQNIMDKTKEFVTTKFPDIILRSALIAVGPRGDSSVEVRFYGKDNEVLANLAGQAMKIMHDNGGLDQVRTSWRNKVRVLEPVYDEEKAKKVFVSYADLAASLRYNFNGVTLGYLNQGYNYVPIVSKPVASQYNNIDWIKNAYVQSSATGRYVPIDRVISGVKTKVEYSVITREDRVPYVAIMGQHTYGGALDRFIEVRKDIENIELPNGYRMKWYGVYEKSGRATGGLKAGIVPALIIMTILILMLFNSVRQLVLICFSVPFILIGIFYGLYISNNPFNFVAILATISLVGIFIKNAIVLIDEFNVQLRRCKGNVYQAVRTAGVLRVKPVALTALTTMLGMIPLTTDVFFEAMAYVIIFGLLFSVFLSSFLLPVFLCLFYGKKHNI